MIISKTSVTPIKYYCDGEEIDKTKYQKILNIIRNKPVAPEGFDYRLTNKLTWELFEVEYAETDILIETEE